MRFTASVLSAPNVPRLFQNWVGKWVAEKFPNPKAWTKCTEFHPPFADLKCMDDDELLNDALINYCMQLLALCAEEQGLKYYYL